MRKYTKKDRHQNIDQTTEEIIPVLWFESRDYVPLDGQPMKEERLFSHCQIWGGMPEVYLLVKEHLDRFLEIQERLHRISISINRTEDDILLSEIETEKLEVESWNLLNEAFEELRYQGRSSSALKKQAIVRYWQLRGY